MLFRSFDFLTQETKAPIAQKIAEEASDLKEFIDFVLPSYLGLYEILQNDDEATKLKELVTGKKVDLDQELIGSKKGNLIVGRVVNFGGSQIVFGDYGEFPEHTKISVLDMVLNKISIFYSEVLDEKEAYYKFMKNAGPYWFSIIAQEDGEILDPDYYLKFYKYPQKKF